MSIGRKVVGQIENTNLSKMVIFHQNKFTKRVLEPIWITIYLKIGIHLLGIVLKMDAEGSEWEVFAHAQIDDLKKFQQLVIEIHNPAIAMVSDIFRLHIRKKALHNLYNAGFVIVYAHGNMHCPYEPCLEVTFARVDHKNVFKKKQCNYPVNTHLDVNNPYITLDHPFYELNITKHLQTFENNFPKKHSYVPNDWFEEDRSIAEKHPHRLSQGFHLDTTPRQTFMTRQVRLRPRSNQMAMLMDFLNSRMEFVDSETLKAEFVAFFHSEYVKF